MTVETKPTPKTEQYVLAAKTSDLAAESCHVAHVEGHTIALFRHEGKIHAVDNRCPHMGFPLSRGSVKDCILTCHWHHARFDLATGGTFDLWADDVRVFPVEIRGDEVWVDVAPPADPKSGQTRRLRDGLERNIPLVIAKTTIRLLDGTDDAVDPFRAGLEFGVRYRQAGWGQGLTILTCMMNLLPDLEPEERPRALYHGLAAVAQDSDGMAPRFMVRPLPNAPNDASKLKAWFRRFIEVRDAQGAERCIVSAVRGGVPAQDVADMLFAAATDHRYIQIGHVLDFTNKAFDALDRAGWDAAELVLSSLAAGYANAPRMEESNAWRHPIDLVAILDGAFKALPAALEDGRKRGGSWSNRTALTEVVLGDDPAVTADALLEALGHGATPEQLAGAVTYAAAVRIARFHTSNEFGDWDTALHTFTFANAVQQGLSRAPSLELTRGVFDAAMSVYLDRFLNVPAVPLPKRDGDPAGPDAILRELPALLDHQQQVDQSADLVARYLASDGDPARLKATLGRLLLREDRDFHTIQCVEAAFCQHNLLAGTPEATHVLIAAARYLAAHSPTVRAQGQTYRIAQRLHRGERLYEED